MFTEVRPGWAQPPELTFPLAERTSRCEVEVIESGRAASNAKRLPEHMA